MDLFEQLDSRDEAWAWTGLDEPDIAYGGDGVRAEQGEPLLRYPSRAAPCQRRRSSSAPDMPDGRRARRLRVWLERDYRFGLDSAIGRLSLAIRRAT